MLARGATPGTLERTRIGSMPCYRCGVRQTDPDRGQSPWRRGVRNDCQVLVCPDCQVAHDWTGDLDRCPRCGSVHLVRRLGEVECRDCGKVVPPSGPPEGLGGSATGGGAAHRELSHGGEAPGLSEEVALALDRVLGRSVVRG
jgi:hypothetical protein